MTVKELAELLENIQTICGSLSMDMRMAMMICR